MCTTVPGVDEAENGQKPVQKIMKIKQKNEIKL